jgi:hypothetical protein
LLRVSCWGSSLSFRSLLGLLAVPNAFGISVLSCFACTFSACISFALVLCFLLKAFHLIFLLGLLVVLVSRSYIMRSFSILHFVSCLSLCSFTFFNFSCSYTSFLTNFSLLVDFLFVISPYFPTLLSSFVGLLVVLDFI